MFLRPFGHTSNLFGGAKYLLVLCVLVSANVWSATEVALYKERVVVSSNASQKEQSTAIEVAFKRLLVRVTGIKETLNEEAVTAELKKGSRYLASFRFESSDEFFSNVLGEKVPTKAMILEFDKKSVDSFLVQNRLPVWGAKRPEVLVWVADRFEGTDHILSDAEDSGLSVILAGQSDDRGVPFVLPIMDLTDTLSLSFTEVYGLFSKDIEDASARYAAEAVLAGRLSQQGEEYRGDWLMLFKGERLRLPTVSGTLDEVVSQGIDLVAQRLSQQYAFILDPLLLGSLGIKVVNIQNVNDFAALEAYLKSINLITKVTVRSFKETDITFDVEISGDQLQLGDILALDKQLIPVEEATLEAQLDNVLLFEWSAE